MKQIKSNCSVNESSLKLDRQYTRQRQQGRTLTGMLGILAIMGILAIGGVWAYNVAMDKLRANTLLNEAQKRAVVVAGQIGFQGRTDPTLIEFQENEFAGGTFSTDVVTNGLYQQFGILVSGVSKRVCENILTATGEGTPIRRLAYAGNPTEAISSCNDTNTFLMVYNSNMSLSSSDTQYIITGCGCQTTCGQCIFENGQPRCVNECPSSEQTCQQNTDCSGECVSCNQTTHTCQICTRLAYLESTGTQYIDSHVTPNYDTKIECVFSTTADAANSSRNYIFGVGTGGNCIQYSYSPTAFYGAGGANATPTISVDRDQHHLIIDKSVFTFDGQTVFTGGQNYSCGSLNIFAKDSSYNSKAKIYSFRIWKNNNLSRDFVPVLDGQNKPALFDRVNKQLYYNSGTGEFSYGN